MTDNLSIKNINRRLKGKSPSFFNKLTAVFMTIGAIGSALAIAPIALPTILVTASGYMILAGAVGTAVSKLTTTNTLPLNEQETPVK